MRGRDLALVSVMTLWVILVALWMLLVSLVYDVPTPKPPREARLIIDGQVKDCPDLRLPPGMTHTLILLDGCWRLVPEGINDYGLYEGPGVAGEPINLGKPEKDVGIGKDGKPVDPWDKRWWHDKR
jgi:hypothetical protein